MNRMDYFKQPETMGERDKEKEDFLKGAISRGADRAAASSQFDMAKGIPTAPPAEAAPDLSKMINFDKMKNDASMLKQGEAPQNAAILGKGNDKISSDIQTSTDAKQLIEGNDSPAPASKGSFKMDAPDIPERDYYRPLEQSAAPQLTDSMAARREALQKLIKG